MLGTLVGALEVRAIPLEQDAISAVAEGINEVRDAAGNRSLLDVFDNVIKTLLFVIGAVSVLMLIIGGIRYVISSGNQTAVEGAKNTILYAIIGLIIAFVAWGIVDFVISRLQ